MKIEALNCPNCGAAVSDDSTTCAHCRSRLKTMSCGHCFETIFEGSNFCPLCGGKAVAPENLADRQAGKCPRCRERLAAIDVSGVRLDECERCAGVWCDIDTFETVCSEKEGQSAVLKRLSGRNEGDQPAEIRYVPCPACGELMNRSNFAKISGVVIDTCKPHGVWFDAQELPRIIEFIRKGGLDLARNKEKLSISEERERLKQERFKMAVEQNRGERFSSFERQGATSAIRQFIDFLLD